MRKVLYPKFLTLRCTPDMLKAVRKAGGGDWLRPLIAKALESTAGGVSLDRQARRRVKSRPSRVT
jgi:hypothetical protein